MIRVMIVDDEPFVRNCLVTGVRWAENGFEIVEVCKNGLEASEALKDARPDVVISDVKMPYMDGIELLTFVKQNHPRMHVLIISGYEEFEYVKHALDCHADGYLLKPVAPDDLIGKMLEIAKAILQERRECDERRAPQNILRSALYGQLSGAWTTGIEDAYLELDEEYYVAMRVQVDNSAQRAGAFEALEREFSGAGDGYLYEDSHRGHILLVSGRDVERARRLAEQYASQAAAAVEKSGVLQFGITVGDAHQGLEGVLVSLDGADASMFLRCVIGSEKIFYRWRKYPAAYRSFRTEVLDIVRSIEHGDRDRARQRLARVFDAAPGSRSSAPEVKRFSENLLYTLSENQGLLHLDGNAEILHECAGEIALASGTAEARRALDALVDGMIAPKSESNAPGSAINDAKCYIKSHLSDPDLSLSGVAKHLCHSPAYFCTLFSSVCGVSLTQYIILARMEKAQGLLRQTDMQVQEISEAVGYVNANYFTKLFKRETGVAPKEFRSAGTDGD